MDCKYCNNPVRAGARYCTYCGSAQEKHSGPCPHCGRLVSQGMKFCRHCGHSLEGVFCPLCQRINRPKVKYCAHCGAQMAVQALADPYGTGKLPIGLVLNRRYVITRKIAQGGMGAVYEAKEVPVSPDSHRLAIKEMSFSMLSHLKEAQQKAVVEGFRREYDLLSKLSHPNLVRAFEFFEENGRQYFVMEYIEGKTLETLIELLPPGVFFPIEHVLDWARQLCNALHYLHSQSPPIIYRDLKPSNIMEVSGSHLVKLFDFGIARYYKPGQLSDTVRFGTDGYLAPEIISYQTQTSQLTDVFALGAVLHQLLTCFDPQMNPWRRPSIRSVNPLVPESVLKAIEHALSLNPGKRSAGADVVLKELFGAHAEMEITGISLQNPFTQEYVTAGSQEVSGDVTVGQVSAAPAPNVPTPGTAVYLDLGKIQKGGRALRQLQVAAPPAATGRAECNVAWLSVYPQSISLSESRLTVAANTRNLPLSSWGNASKPNWYTNLPGFLGSWLGIHCTFLIALPCRHTGQVMISFPGYMNSVIEATIEVQPTYTASVIGWIVVAALVSIELILFVLVLLSFLLVLL